MEHSTLTKLPGEIRNTIWEYALTVNAVELTIRPGYLRPRLHDASIYALTKTCRQIRAESTPFFLSNRIKLEVITDEAYLTQEYDIHLITETLKAWVRSFDNNLHQCLTRLELHLIGYNTNGSSRLSYDDANGSRIIERDANLYEAEVFLVYLQKHFIEHFSLTGARLILHNKWTHEPRFWFKPMVLDFSAHNSWTMLRRIFEERQKAECGIDGFENEIYYTAHSEKEDLRCCLVRLDALLEALDRNPQWIWTSPEPKEEESDYWDSESDEDGGA